MPLHDPISVLALDVDKTVLNNDHEMPAAVQDAITRVRNAGALVVFASGRSPAAMRTAIRPHDGRETIIAYNGAWVGDIGGQPDDSHLRYGENRLSVAAARQVVTAARSHGIAIGWYVDETVYLDGATALFTAELAITGESSRITDLGTLSIAPHKLLAIGDPDQDLTNLAAALAPISAARFSASHLLEISAPGVSKANGLAAFCQHLGLALSHVAAIGDAENDLEMIRAAGIGIAMGNAIASVKEAARWVTATNDEAGVAVAIDRLFAENLIVPIR
ncbi:MAG: Cof-type HAD-IIB family hydrolase [Azospirillaceae bacterium]|nr:Cof-type HAD-IIB family hydrolase [Azospirillaceae bacterium]